MRKIRKHITTIILAVLAVIAGVYAYNYHDMKQNIVYNEHLEDVAVNVNGKELTLRDMAFYVAYEEMNVEKQALVYDSDNPNKYWNIHTNGEFVRSRNSAKAQVAQALGRILQKQHQDDKNGVTSPFVVPKYIKDAIYNVTRRLSGAEE